MTINQKATTTSGSPVGAAPEQSRLRGLLKKKYDPKSFQTGIDAAQAQLEAAQAQAIDRKNVGSKWKSTAKKRAEVTSAKNQLADAMFAQTSQATGRNRDGSYVRPEFETLIDQNTGRLFDEYSLAKQFNPVQADRAGYDQYKTEALRTGPSAYAQMMMGKQELEQQGLTNNLAAQQNAGMRGAMDQLAATGGVDSGARERMARSGIRDAMMGRQDIRKQGMIDRFNISAQDEQQRQGQLQNLTGMELNRANYDASERDKGLGANQYDIQNSLLAMDRERGDSMDAWKTNMQTWGANKTADAQKAASGSGGGK